MIANDINYSDVGLFIACKPCRMNMMTAGLLISTILQCLVAKLADCFDPIKTMLSEGLLDGIC